MLMNLKSILEKYEKKLKSINPIGMGLYIRILSCISLTRELDKRFYSKEKNNPEEYLANVFDVQMKMLENIDNLMDYSEIKDLPFKKFREREDDPNDLLHKELFNKTWKTLELSSDPLNDYRPYMDLIQKRLKINNLDNNYFKEKKCLDVGCGTGRFCFAMSDLGAISHGIDPGIDSIEHAKKLSKLLNFTDTVHFKEGNAYDIQFENESFDFLVCNGVLHHLDHPILALEEFYRVLKKDGQFWLYIEGSGGIYHDVWNIIRKSFTGIPLNNTFEALDKMLIPNKHFWMDIFYATYHFISWQENYERLRSVGFSEVKRMKGAELIDLDIEMFRDDPWANIKFGDGGLRMLITK